MKRNTAGQVVTAQLIDALTGEAYTGTAVCWLLRDLLSQTLGVGTCSHMGNGLFAYYPTQAETNADHIAFTFVGTGAIPASVQVYTNFPQSGDSFTRTDLSTFNPLTQTVSVVQAFDAFTDVADVLLQSHIPTGGGFWSRHSTSTSHLETTGLNSIRILSESANGGNGMYYHSLLISRNQWAALDFDFNNTDFSSAGVGPCVRINEVTNSFVTGRISKSGTDVYSWQIVARINGTDTVLATVETDPIVTGRVKLYAIDDDYLLYADDELVLQAHNTQIRDAGKVGLRMFQTGSGAATERMLARSFAGDRISADLVAGYVGDVPPTVGEIAAGVLLTPANKLATNLDGSVNALVDIDEVALATALLAEGVASEATSQAILMKVNLLKSGVNVQFPFISASGTITLFQGFDFTASGNASIEVTEAEVGQFDLARMAIGNFQFYMRSQTSDDDYLGPASATQNSGLYTLEAEIESEDLPTRVGIYDWWFMATEAGTGTGTEADDNFGIVYGTLDLRRGLKLTC